MRQLHTVPISKHLSTILLRWDTHCLSESRKYWTVIPKGYSKPVRLKNLGEEYSEEAIKRRLIENQRLPILPFSSGNKSNILFQPEGIKSRKRVVFIACIFTIVTSWDTYQKYKKPDTNKLHYLLREDLLKLDKISEEARLLGRENISTDKQLFSYKESVMGEISKLTDDRTNL